jgi:hypothetical protein
MAYVVDLEDEYADADVNSQFIQVKLTKISYIKTLSNSQFIQVKLTKISYIRTISNSQFIQNFHLLRVAFRQVLL